MRISRIFRAAVAGALTVVGAFTALPSADAATPGSVRGTESATAARANLTVITEVQNAMEYPVWLYVGENNSWFGPIDAHGVATGNLRVPWVGKPEEMSKSIRVYKDGLTCPPDGPCHPYKFHLYHIFQDYWQPNDQVKYTGTGVYEFAQPVPGSSTGGGNKRLIIGKDKPQM